MITVIDMKTMREEGIARARQALSRNQFAAAAALARCDFAEFDRLAKDRKLIRRDLRRMERPAFCPSV